MKKNPSHKKAINKPELSALALELIAARFRALSEPLRLRLLNLLMQGETSVGQLVEAAASSQANVSKHLAVLRDTGMVAMRKEGTSTLCRIADPMVYQLCELMCARLRDEIDGQSRALPRVVTR